jgi:hypothetical protein
MSGAVAVLATGYAKDALFTDILLTLRDPFVRAELIRANRAMTLFTSLGTSADCGGLT